MADLFNAQNTQGNVIETLGLNDNFLENQRKFFDEIKQDENFVGHLYDLDYNGANVLINDFHKIQVQGIPHGCFLIAIYNNEIKSNTTEGILLRVIGTAEIPQKKEIIESITDSYIGQKELSRQLSPDAYTKNFYQFSGLSCRVLGTFYVNKDKKLIFGTDIDNFIGAHNYRVYKPKENALDIIVNQNANKDNENEVKEEIGALRYASSQSSGETKIYAPKVWLRTNDIIARRSAFFGMTRMGKSNTIKIIISAIESLNRNLNQKIGQIIFDINGEYTFSNEQDKGSIYDKFKASAIRFSVSPKKAQQEDVRAIQYNFYNDETLEESFNLLCDELSLIKSADYFKDFRSIDMFGGDDEREAKNARDRKRAIYKCILHRARFEQKESYKLRFYRFTIQDKSLDAQDKERNKPHEGISIKEACQYFENLDFDKVDEKYKTDKQYLALLKVLQAKGVSGYKALMDLKHLHSLQGTSDYKKDIDSALRNGKIVLVDLSTASTKTQQLYIEKLCQYIFDCSMNKFTNDEKPELIQMYFEEAHNIFPKDDKDLKNIYNRLAKEGAKLNIGISYSTQEVSSIAPSILKNTQNWFISHLNNSDEIRALEKYYDFKDFSQSIIRNSDVGFARVKTFSNNFIIPVQIKKFES